MGRTLVRARAHVLRLEGKWFIGDRGSYRFDIHWYWRVDIQSAECKTKLLHIFKYRDTYNIEKKKQFKLGDKVIIDFFQCIVSDKVLVIVLKRCDPSSLIKWVPYCSISLCLSQINSIDQTTYRKRRVISDLIPCFNPTPPFMFCILTGQSYWETIISGAEITFLYSIHKMSYNTSNPPASSRTGIYM